MWVLFWAGVPRFWLTGNTSLTIGRRVDSDVTINDDPSISRTHCTITVGVSKDAENPAPITLTDTSSLGSTVLLQGVPQRLLQNVSWCPPSGTLTFTLTLGTHGAALECVWDPLPLVIKGFPPAERNDVLSLVYQCGGSECADIAGCRALLAKAVEPTAALVAALCLAKPIIGIDYLRNIKARSAPKVPPAALDTSLSLPSVMHPIWGSILGVDPSAVPPSTFLPRAERRNIFSGVLFLCLQPTLYEELTQYLPHTGARLALADIPPLHSSGAAVDVVKPTAIRYQSHVIVHTALAPINSVVFDALQQEGLATVDYSVLIRCILNVERLPSLHSSSPPRVTGRISSEHTAPPTSAAVPEQALPDINAALTSSEHDKAPKSCPLDPQPAEDLVVSTEPPLPPFPCFREPHPRGQAVPHPQRCDKQGQTKRFVKQYVVPQPVTLEDVAVYAPRRLGEDRRCAAAVAVDADDIIPMDTTMQNISSMSFRRAIHRSLPPVVRRPRSALDEAFEGEAAAPHRLANQPRPRKAAQPHPEPPVVPPLECRGIFDIDNLY